MAKTPGYFDVVTCRDAVYIRVTGLANMNNSLLFKEFVEEVLGRGFRLFYVDLGPCKGMDSTFMGVLAGIHKFRGSGGITRVTIVNASEHNRGLLETLGLSTIVRIKEGLVELPEKVRMQRLEGDSFHHEARLEMIQKAHRHLVEIDEKNQERFGPFLEALEMELAASGGKTPPPDPSRSNGCPAPTSEGRGTPPSATEGEDA